jgi:pimeloyl-ACP methyl ester carboxylesterase
VSAATRPHTSSGIERLVERYDASVFHLGRPHARIRLSGRGIDTVDVVIERERARLEPANGDRPDAELIADADTWETIASDVRGGMSAFRGGRLRVRRDLHLGVGFLAATAGTSGDRRLRVRQVETGAARISTIEAGAGEPVVAIHGLGATKASFLPTVASLAPSHHVFAIDLPGFGDSDKPIAGSYDPAFFARAIRDLLDTLDLERAHLIGNSMGGRVSVEVGLRYPERVASMTLLAPSLAWLRARPWAKALRLVPTQLGLIQPTPRPVVEAILKRLLPGAENQWTAAGVDEFLRSYLTPSGRAAFYAAARSIYLEEPWGPNGFWTRLPSLRPPALFVWGKRDALVPIAFQRHVRQALPSAEHLELECGHVPQLERPRETHDAIRRFLSAA